MAKKFLSRSRIDHISVCRVRNPYMLRKFKLKTAAIGFDLLPLTSRQMGFQSNRN